MIRKLALTGVLLLALAACDNATTGRVVNKAYEEPYSYPDTECAVWISNSQGIMNCFLWETKDVAVPECWRIGFHNDADDEDGTACVAQRDFEAYNQGDQYPRPR